MYTYIYRERERDRSLSEYQLIEPPQTYSSSHCIYTPKFKTPL